MNWTELAAIDPGVSGLSAERIDVMALAAHRIGLRAMKFDAAGMTPVSAVLPADSQIFEWRHYPEGDVSDPATGCQFFYHAHPKLEQWDEHGHFHLFGHGRNSVALSHLIAISVDRESQPVRLFTTNRWVTDEHWLDGMAVIELLARYKIQKSGRLGLVGEWLTDLMVLFGPQVEALLLARNGEVERRIAAGPDRDAVFEDRQLECVSYMEIDLGRQLSAVGEASG